MMESVFINCRAKVSGRSHRWSKMGCRNKKGRETNCNGIEKSYREA